jgi:diaminopimelate epimerase
MFPERTSVLWAVVASRDEIRVRIWERGVGETLGCGSGAAAVAVLANRAGWVDAEVNVVSKGGALQVRPQPDGVVLTGQASYVFRGEVYV